MEVDILLYPARRQGLADGGDYIRSFEAPRPF